jgi:hypothetical protein
MVNAVAHSATSTATQIARPSSSFFTYGSLIASVRNGVLSDLLRKTRTGSSSYWCDTRRVNAMMKGIKSYEVRVMLVSRWGYARMGHMIIHQKTAKCGNISRIRAKNEILTKKRLLFGFTSKNTSENAVASAIHNVTRPATSLTNADTGVKFPNALALKKRGNASCSIARKQYSFCA